MMQLRARRNQRPAVVALVIAVAALMLAWARQFPAGADVSGITASAFGYYTNIGFNGEPLTVRGFGQTIPPGTLQSESPSVSCPSTGTSEPMVVTDPDGALAKYGEATFFSGQWLPEQTAPPPSGSLTVGCEGTTGPTGSTSSSADVINVGPGPFLADEVHSTCTASESGVTGTTTILGGVLITSTDANGQPATTEPIPIGPDVNYTRHGTLDYLGDTYRIVLNEQIEDPVTGTLTVNAAHLYFFGPTIVGEVVIGSSTCGVAVTASTTTTAGQTTTTAGDTTTTAGPTTTTTGDTTTTTAGDTTTTTAATTTTTAATTTTTQPGDVAAALDRCRDGGWTRLGFKNPGECARSVARRSPG